MGYFESLLLHKEEKLIYYFHLEMGLESNNPWFTKFSIGTFL